ncbi:beta strand repeat-containing protein, partial [Dokdonia pacifica]|uniref:beta strand repeat-containing protein n=1 Tax=Dokdonia pacifica TaxID=1627892 RepID=UPI0018895D1F
MKKLYAHFSQMLKTNVKLNVFLALFAIIPFVSFAQNCTVNAGSLNQTFCEGSTITLTGNDVMPRIGDVSWTQISGPSVIIDTPNMPVTTVTGTSGGNTYIFRFSAVCGDGIESFQDKTVTIEGLTEAVASDDIASCPDASGGLIISGNTPEIAGEIGVWSVVTPGNPAGVTIASLTSPTTTITLSSGSCGTTTLAWTIEREYSTGRFCTSVDFLDVTNFGGEMPVEVLSGDQMLSNCYTATQSTTIQGSNAGCGLGGQSGMWSFVSGPAVPSFGNASNASTNVSGLIEGIYTLRWTASGPCVSGFADTVITVPAATQDITPVGGTVNIVICDTSVNDVTLEGIIPGFAGEEVSWTQTGGGNTVTFSPTPASTVNTLVSGINSANDPYQFTFTLENATTGCFEEKIYNVRYRNNNRTVTANNGDDQLFGDCGMTRFNIPVSNTGSGSTSYSIISGPAGSGFIFPTSPQNVGSNLSVDLLEPGTYVIEFNRTQAGEFPIGCTDGFDAISVIVSNGSPDEPNAGTGVTLPCAALPTSVNLSGSAITIGTSEWSLVNGPTSVTISDPYAQNITVNGLDVGTYTFRYANLTGPNCPIASSTVDITVNDPVLTTATAATVAAGTVVCPGESLQLQGSVPGDGEIGTWSASPGGLSFTPNVNDPNAVAEGFIANETYTLTWTIDYVNPQPTCSGASSADVSFTTSNDPPLTPSTIGNVVICASGTTQISLEANAVMAPEQGTWSVVPAGATFSPNANDPNAIATVPGNGTYTFKWTIDDSTSPCGTTEDSVVVTIADPIVADAGTDQQICATSTTMDATISSGAVGTWTYVSGPGGFTFADVNDPLSSVSFIFDGLYTFSWDVQIGDCDTQSTTVDIEVGLPPTIAAITPPSSTVLCNQTTLTLNAANPINTATEVGTWSLLAGAPNNPTIVTSSDFNTASISGLTTGFYTFRLTIVSTGNSICAPGMDSFEDITIEVIAPATAGAPLEVRCNVENVILTGTVGSNGTWTCVGGDCGSVTITPTSPYTANAAVVPNTTPYVFEYTIPASGGCDPGSAQTTVRVDAVPDMPEPVASPDELFICIGDTMPNGSVPISGNTPGGGVSSEWSIEFQPSTANAMITDDTAQSTTVTGLTVPGLYILEYTFSSGACTKLSDVLRITMYEPPTTSNAGPDDLEACELDYMTAANTPSVGIGTWTIINSPPGSSTTIDNPNNPVTSLSDIALGTYELQWTITNGPLPSPFPDPSACDPSISIVTVQFNDVPPSVAMAGPDQVLCNQTQTNLAAIAPTSGIGTWSQNPANPSGAVIAPPSDTDATVFGLSTGTYEFIWTTTTTGNDGCSFEDRMIIEVIDQPISSEAGPNLCVPAFTNVNLEATPVTSPEVGTWTQVSGPTSANFVDENSPTTAVTNTAIGIYIFEWTVSNGNCTPVADQMELQIKGISDLEITKLATPTSANVGETINYSISIFNNDANATNSDASGVSVEDILPAGLTLVPGSVSNGGIFNAGNTTITWTDLDIPSGATISVVYSAIINAMGPYTNSAQIIASDQFDPDSDPTTDSSIDDLGDGNPDDDETTFTVALGCEEPTAEAGTDVNLCADFGSYTLIGSSIGGSATEATWSVTTNPGTAGTVTPTTALADPSTATFTATAAGVYILTLTTDFNAPCVAAATDTVTITVTATPTVDAGPATAAICSDMMYTVTGSSSSNGTIAWTTSGSGSFNNASAENPIYTPSPSDVTSGSITLTKTVTGNGTCSSSSVSDTVTLTINEDPTLEAGSNTALCSDAGAYTLSDASIGGGATEGTWSITTSPTMGDGVLSVTTATANPETVTFTATVSGDYILTLTTNATAPCSAAVDTVTITIEGEPTVDAGPATASICSDMMYTVTGSTSTNGTIEWTTSGSGSFSDATIDNPVYTASDLDISAGTVTLTKTVTTSGACSASPAVDSVTLTINEDPTAEAGDDTNLCTDFGSYTLVGSSIGGGATTGIWTITQPTGGDGTVTPATATASPETASFSATVAGVYVLTLTSNATAPCSPATDIVTITVEAAPTVDAGPATASICSDMMYTVTGGTSTNGTILWTTSGTGTFNDDTAENPVYTPSAQDVTSGVVTLTKTVTGSGACASTFVRDNVTLTINEDPTAEAGDDTSLCTDFGSYTLVGSSIGGGATTGIWTITQPTGGDGAVTPATATASPETTSFSATVAGVYVLTLTSNATAPCSPATDTVTITVEAAPTVDAGPATAAICSDMMYTVTGSTSTNGTIEWTTSGSGSFSDATIDNPVYTASVLDVSATTITLTKTVTGTGACGTSSVSDTTVLTINEDPTVEAGSDTALCSDAGAYTLSDASIGGGATEGTWSITTSPTMGDGVLSITTATATPETVTFTATVPGDYILTLTTNATAPCSAAVDTVTITIEDEPTVDAGPATAAICSDMMYTVTGGTSTNGTIEWTTSGSGSFSDATIDNPVYTASALDVSATTITLTKTVTGTGACGTSSVSDTTVLTINEDPTVEAGSD